MFQADISLGFHKVTLNLTFQGEMIFKFNVSNQNRVACENWLNIKEWIHWGTRLGWTDYIFISRGAEGPGREILQRPPSVRPSVCLSVRHV